MKAATSAEIKKALQQQSVKSLVEICLRLARFKKENKELLTFILFEAGDLQAYINSVKQQIDEGFREVNTSSMYYAKKTLRKILRMANKFIRYCGDPAAEVEILLHYAQSLKGLKLAWEKSTALKKLNEGVLRKIRAAISSMHEDLQYDYLRSLATLEK
jgi:hypothetical protein